MDAKLIKAAVAAHDKALDSAVKDPNLVTSKADFAAVNEALARMSASSNKDKFYKLLDAFPDNKQLQMDLYNQNEKAAAQQAYQAFKYLTAAVKAASTNGADALPITPVTGGPIGDEAAKFGEATYPLTAKIDWANTQQITKYVSEISAKNPKGVAAAFDKVLESGLTTQSLSKQLWLHKALDNAVNNPGLVTSKAERP